MLSFLKCLCLSILLFAPYSIQAQNLHFTYPALLLPEATTDKAISITNFNGGYFVAWKSPGSNAELHYSYLGKTYDTTSSHHEAIIPGAKTNFAPTLRVSNGRIYLFWITTDGKLNYLVNQTDTSFSTEKTYALPFQSDKRLSSGITSAAVGNHILLAAHTDKQQLVYMLALPMENGLFSEAPLQSIPGSGSTEYPFVVAIDDDSARFCWRQDKDKNIYYSDLNIKTGGWSQRFRAGNFLSAVSPAVYRVWKSQRLFYIWNTPGKEGKLSYATDSLTHTPSVEYALPDYFTTNNPVAICHIDNNNFLLALTGKDQRIYVSKFANYNPATWVQDILLQEKGSYTLQDIVIPGSHDAGMSVLSGVGGTQSGTINECNTLTQKKNIADQLNAGMRMFDLRVGTYRDTLYTKHCSSNCMADAIGGGYGQRLDIILNDIRQFLLKNDREFILLTFSHLCERETPVEQLATKVLKGLGQDIVYYNTGSISTIPLTDLAGKVIITIEGYARSDRSIDSCSIAERSGSFINFRREYAATNSIDKLLQKELQFFYGLRDGIRNNDLIRLDWQLTQAGDEAAMICNDFQNEKTNPLIDGVMVLTNVVRRHRSIIDLSIAGNKYLPGKVNEWINNRNITTKNKPNILYVDVAGQWITDYCITLNQSGLYSK